MTRIRETTLTRFIKDECANFDKHDQECLSGGACKVLNGQRCGYFEKAVLEPQGYPYRLPGYDYGKLFAQYAEQTGANKRKVKARRCECGNPLRSRQRYCDGCAEERRRETKRNAMRKYRYVHAGSM